MNIDFDLFVKIFSPILGVCLGIFLERRFKEKPNLISYISQASAIYTKTPEGKPLNVHTHSIVLQNSGTKPANNLKIGHNVLPAFSIYPSVEHTVKELSDGTKEIRIPSLVPKESITINYLYFPPTLWSNINKYTKSDEGFAKIVNMQLTPKYSRGIKKLSILLVMVGLSTLIYLFVLLVKWIFSLIWLLTN